MTETGSKFLSFADLMSAIVAFMFRWSRMEQALTDAITEARERLEKPHSKIKGSFAERETSYRKGSAIGLASRL